MKFSLFFELQISEPSRAAEAAVVRQTVEQAELADKLGYHAVWATEHHGLYEYSHCSAPEVLLSFIAGRTQRIHIGHGVTLLPHRYNHPIRVAERVAMLDLVSEGRVLWGTGKSSTATELGAFGIDRADLDAQWEEALRIIPNMWTQDVFEYSGKHFQIPPTQIIPKPFQAPHPPVFAACTRLETALHAGRLGLGTLNFSMGTMPELRNLVKEYRRAAAEAVPATHRAVNHVACAPAALVLGDDKRACEYGFRGARFFRDGMEAYYWTEQRPTGPLAARRGFHSHGALERARAGRGQEDDAVHALIGDPVFARDYVRTFEEAGVDELILVMQMGTVPPEVVLESVKTFGEQVLPHFSP